MPGGAALARAYGTQVELCPGGSHPRRPQMQKSLLVEQAFRLRLNACPAALRLRGPTEHKSNSAPRRFSSSQASDEKACSLSRLFGIWSVIEDNSPLRGSPCGPLLTQRSLASLESNLLPPEVSHPHRPQMQKSLLVEQAFRIWSVIEDSNLRPLRPERSALPGCANHRMRGASYCWDAYPSMPYFQKIAQPARNSAA